MGRVQPLRRSCAALARRGQAVAHWPPARRWHAGTGSAPARQGSLPARVTHCGTNTLGRMGMRFLPARSRTTVPGPLCEAPPLEALSLCPSLWQGGLGWARAPWARWEAQAGPEARLQAAVAVAARSGRRHWARSGAQGRARGAGRAKGAGAWTAARLRMLRLALRTCADALPGTRALWLALL